MTTKRVTLAAVIFLFLGLFMMMGGCASQKEPTAGATQPQAEPLVAIGSIESSETDNATFVTIAGNGPLTFSSFKKPDPPSVVLIFPATTVSQLPPAPVLDSELIEQVVVSEGNGGSTARIEFKLTADASYTATQQEDKVWLTFQRPENGMAEAEKTAVPASGTSTEAAKAAPTPEIKVEKPVEPAIDIPKSTAWVNKIDFLSESDGKSTLMLGTTHVVDYRINKVDPKKIELKLLNTRIPAYRQRALITTRFDSAVDRVVPFQASKQKDTTMVSIEMRQAVPYYVEQTDNLLLVHFESSSVPPKPMEQANLPAWKRALSNDDQMEAAGGAAPEINQKPAVQPVAPADGHALADGRDYYQDESIEDDIELKNILAPRRKVYTGEKIALDFYDTDIKNVFRILREVSGKNFAIDKDVTGKVTMTLDKPVPWDQVLDLVLRMNQLGQTHEGDIVRIATLETLKNEDNLRKAKLEALRKSRDEAKALQPLVTKYIAVSYANANEEIMPHLEKILTEGRGSISVDQKNNQIIITDTAEKVSQASDIVRRIDKVTSQVIIEAKVVEVSNDFSRSLGIDWDLAYGDTSDPLNTANTDWSMNFPSTTATSTIGVTFSRLSGVPYVINAQLNALQTTGEGRILSSPKILTLDNKKAMIKQGLEYPYFERDSSGGSSIKFKNIDLLLEVTPHVTPDDRISMAILLTKNDVDSLVGGVPALATNEAETELLVNDGDTVVIGGIIKASENDATAGFPGLSNIPLLGWLFKTNTRSTENNELLIFITPRIVQLEQSISEVVQ